MFPRSFLRSALLGSLVAVMLACSGALEAIAPEPLVPPPAGSTTTSVNVGTHNGVSTTTIAYDTDAKPSEVSKHYKERLDEEGWKVSSQRDGDRGVLTATKGDETFTVTIERGSFTTVWTD
jgi:hypothetical protein